MGLADIVVSFVIVLVLVLVLSEESVFQDPHRISPVDGKGSDLSQLNAQMPPKKWAAAELYSRTRASRLQ
jgi:hypothetical protein